MTDVRTGSSRDEVELPVDFHRTPHTVSRLESYAFELGAPAQTAHTPAHLLTAVFAILLARWSGQRSVSLSTSTRTGKESSRPVRALRLETSLETTCRDILARIEEGTAESSRDDARGERVGFTWLDAEGAGRELDAHEIVADATTNADGAELHLVAVATPTGFRAAFVYDAALFRRTSIERFAGQLQTLLAGAVAALDAPIARLALLSPMERLEIETACTGQTRARADELVPRRIEHFAKTTPDKVAVRHRDCTLTYRELNERANRLARLLGERGIGSEDAVVVCVEPGIEILVALLGILKAGATYVPLDPSYPAKRIEAILEDTRPRLVLTQSRLASKLVFDGRDVLALDAAVDALAPLSGEDLAIEIHPGQTAYVYYTSGTTGRPKGIMASHGNLASYVRLARERYGFGEEEIVPAIARFSFSISMFELTTALYAGGTVLILDRDHIVDPARMSRTLTEVTLFHAGPSLLKNLIPYILQHYSDFSAFAGVRHASSGGDMVPPQVVEALKEIFANAEVFVIYGSSEISCMGCTYPVPRDRTVDKTFVGRPFDDMRVRVLDEARNLLPIGMVGEVHFSGSGLVKGYLNRPELTAEKFVEVEGRRFYRTGDMGRIVEGGHLELVGRSDFQVKIRGMRVELAEVEYHLRSAPGVRDAIVVAKDAPSGEKSLVAYVVIDRACAAPDRAVRKATLRRHMVDRVPDYMVPAIYVELESLPLNHNMKVDRRAVPDVTAEDLGDGGETAERIETPNERRMRSIWTELLGIDDVSLDANFFEVGGDSLLGARLLACVEAELGVRLDGMDVLRESLAVLAAICDAHQGTTRAPLEVARGSRPSTPFGTFHFGPSRSLYGVLHGRPSIATSHAVLVCPPIGHESARAHFVLGQLARQLAARGVPVMRFDYFGTGSSLGDSSEATCTRWREDVECAYDELRRRTGAARVTVVGVRLGGTLVWNALSRIRPDRIVVWDPVLEGAEHLARTSATHRRLLRGDEHGWRRLFSRQRGGALELLGSTYSRSMLDELRTLRVAPLGERRSVRALVTTAPPHARLRRMCPADDPECRIESLPIDCAWDDAEQIETILPDTGLSAALAAMVMEGR